jgi:predicted nuclease with TOPRIM domain
MSTLDEITKEKQRISDALARVDAQREKLTEQLSELEATERVLARYSKGRQAKKMASAKTPTREGGRSSAITWAPEHYTRETSWRQA